MSQQKVLTSKTLSSEYFCLVPVEEKHLLLDLGSGFVFLLKKGSLPDAFLDLRHHKIDIYRGSLHILTPCQCIFDR